MVNIIGNFVGGLWGGITSSVINTLTIFWDDNDTLNWDDNDTVLWDG